MANIYKTTVHGREFNLDQLLARNEKTVAVGDMRMNARGDMLDNKNNIIQTVEEVAAAYQAANKNTVQRIPLSQLDDSVFMSLEDVQEQIAKQTELNSAKKVAKKK